MFTTEKSINVRGNLSAINSIGVLGKYLYEYPKSPLKKLTT